MATCEECGAPDRDGLGCREQWGELLALEFTDPRAGQVHFHTVTTYELQHPSAFPLTDDTRAWMEQTLADVVEGRATVAEVRTRTRRAYDGPRRVLADHAPAPALRRWTRTVADVGAPDPLHHVDRVLAWSRAVLADLAGSRSDR